MRACRAAAPLLLLLAYGAAFGAVAFGRSLPAFDDHPGQFYRLWHSVTHGLAPWAWNPGWWAGYPELQFYPPGFFYLGALLHRATFGAVSLTATYQTLLWLTWLLPGVTVQLVLTRLLGGGWLALPGAFVALTISAGVTSGVEGGVHIGMLPARLGWALLPLLMPALAGWLDRSPRIGVPLFAVPLLAAIVLVHPAHAPAALTLVLLAAAVADGPRGRRFTDAGVVLVLAGLLTSFWALPLVFRLEHARALAWGRLSIVDVLTQPLAALLVGLAALGLYFRDSRTSAALAFWPWAAAAVLALDALVLEPLGLRWLPAARVADGVWMAVIVAAGLTTGRLLEGVAVRWRVPIVPLALAAVVATVLLGLPGRTLTLWPQAADWPSYQAVERGLRLGDLWAALRRGPAGRVLFVRSGVPLVYAPEWWRPHTHVTALTPIHTGREIINGTFTHPSPVAALLYRGSPGPGPITTLVEQLDGRSLFGRPLETLDAPTFNERADRLGVAIVVALDEDLPRLRGLEDNPDFVRRAAIGSFVIYERRAPLALPSRRDDDPRTLVLAAAAGTWVPARIAYYPLWTAKRGDVRLETRRGPVWDLEVKLDGQPGPVDLIYGADPLGAAGALLSALGLLGWIGLWRRQRHLGSQIAGAQGTTDFR